MRYAFCLLACLGTLACDDGGTSPADPTADASPLDAGPDRQIPDAAPLDASPFDARPFDAALDQGLLDAQVDPDRAVDPCGAADPDDPLRLTPDAPFEGEICRDRSAWFVLDIPAGREASVTLSFQHRLGDLELAAYRVAEVREQIAESTSASDQERISLPLADTPRAILIEVYGYRRAVGRYTLEARLFDDAAALDTRAQGTVRFVDKPFDANGFTDERVELPARGVRVEAVRTADGAVVAATRTDLAGAFDLPFRAQPGAHLVRAVSAGGVDAQAVEVRDIDANLLYAVESAPFDAGATLADVALLARASDAIGGALNIVDTANQAFRFYAPFVEGAAPTLTYRWQPGVAHGCGSCYANDTIRLAGAIEDTDEYDDVIILHELWHWFMEHYSADDSPGGAHRDLLVSPVLAFGEGVAYAFAGLARGSPAIVDTFIDATRYIDMEAVTINGEDLDAVYGTGDGTPSGVHREELVEGIIWDSIDPASAAEPFDTVALGLEGGFALLRRLGQRRFIDVGPRGIDVADWLNMVHCDGDDAAALAEDRRYPFAADDAVCEKGRVPAPLELRVVDGRLWLLAKTDLPLTVRRGAPGAWKTTRQTCRGGCDLGLADPQVAVVISAPAQPWAGVSWLGAALRHRLAGPTRHGVRVPAR